MGISKASISIVLGVYSLVNRSGLLEVPIVKKLFRWSYFLYKRHFEDPYFNLIAKHPSLLKDGNVLDVGANVGYTAWVFAQRVSPGFRVFAFEPDPKNFAELGKTAEVKGLRGPIVPIHAAVGVENGFIELWQNENHHADHRVATPEFRSRHGSVKTLRVPQVSIDEFESGPVAFIKIDVQGYELAICEGMKKTLAANPRAAVAIEYAPGDMNELGFAPEKLLAFFTERGYRISVIHRNGGLTPAKQSVLDKALSVRGYVDLLCESGRLASSAPE